MNVEILSTGEELVTGALTDTNATWLAARLLEAGIRIDRQTCVGDDESRLARIMTEMAGRADLVLVTGGLGPTSDDLSAQAAARASGDSLVLNGEALVSMTSFFQKRGWAMPQANIKQAMLPSRATMIENCAGTAPGFLLEIGQCLFFFMPGVPMEMKSMFQSQVLPRIREQFQGLTKVLTSRMTVFGLPESEVGARLAEFPGRFPGISLGFRASFPLIEVKCLLVSDPETGQDAAGQAMDGARAFIQEKLGAKLFSDKGLTMEEEVGRLLTLCRQRVAVAESCTGGLIASMLTDVAGSSDYFLLSAVTYSNDAKIKLLGVCPETIAQNGAVHEKTALEMAMGVRKISGADWGISTSGIAGPGGGSPEKPVGTVCIGIDGPGVSMGKLYRFSFEDRAMNKKLFAVMAMDVLRKNLVQG
ncbi:MAG: CinA family nicotinamide mononucleotide deamidase-related protein [Pseudomonadota bacterium]